MIYTMSDIHGHYAAYMNMLDLIAFSPWDTLYIIGDVIDRGTDGIAILQHIMSQDNITLIRGNHEQVMLDEISGRSKLFTSKGYWRYGLGGLPTWKGYQALPTGEQQAVYDYLKATPLELHVEVDGVPYHLIHGRPSREDSNKLWGRFEKWETFDYPTTEFVVVGHTPTITYQPNTPMRIYFGNTGLIDIDCGCAFPPHGRLACLRLEDWQEFYCADIDLL